MADIADLANDRAQHDLDAAIDAARMGAVSDVESADTCVECGELISSARQIAVPGCQLCTVLRVELLPVFRLRRLTFCGRGFRPLRCECLGVHPVAQQR